MNRKKAIEDLMSETEPHVLSLWLFPEQEFQRWLDLGFGEAESYSEYVARVEQAESAAMSQGVQVVHYTGTPDELKSFMQSQNLKNTQENRALAIGMLAIQD